MSTREGDLRATYAWRLKSTLHWFSETKSPALPYALIELTPERVSEKWE